MKYKRKNNKNSIEIINEQKNNLMTEDFDASEYLDEEFIEESKRSFLNRRKKQEYEYIIDEDDEEEPKKETKKEEEPKKETKKEESKKEIKKESKLVDKKEENKEEVQEQPTLTIEPIRTVTTEEYKEILKQRQEEKEKQLRLEQEKYEKNKKKEKNKKSKKKTNTEDTKGFKLNIKMIINIICILIIILAITTIVDVISVSKYGKGPYFAIKTNTYNDGGTKVYHGIGYKVIKYNQLQGRRDIEIGSWSLKYNVEPITISDIDLAIDFNNNEEKTYKVLDKEFVRINSTLKKVNKKNNTITIGYEDEDGKYTMNIICKMANKNAKLDKLEIGKETTIIGTITSYSKKTSKEPTKLKITNCFAEQ